ncbi:MAG: hypothetical protein H7A32_03625 [Deltaproteobacteria bacterium]|nr:hypothetical protein [Deltaproteobacteria bacterium]
MKKKRGEMIAMVKLSVLLVFVIVLGALLVIFSNQDIQAAGPVDVDPTGAPLRWEQGATIVFNPEHGALKAAGGYDNAKSVNLVKQAFQTWMNISNVNLNYQQGSYLNDGGDVNASNFQNFLYQGTQGCYADILGLTPEEAGPCWAPVIFDEDGSIIESLFGSCNQFSVRAVTKVDDINNMSGDPERRIIRRSSMIINGACIPPVTTKSGCGGCSRELTEEEVYDTIVHEVGHFLGLGHSQVNPDAYDRCKSGGCSGADVEAIPTMFPTSMSSVNYSTLHEDDKAYMRRLYANASNQYCSVSGKVFDTDGVTEVAAVEVVAVDSSSGSGWIAGLSGAESPQSSQGVCTSNCGSYLLTGLQEGRTYQVCAQAVNPTFKGISSIANKSQSVINFPRTCPESMNITCQCSGGTCDTYAGFDITIGQGATTYNSYDPGSSSGSSSSGSSSSNGSSGGAGGGCSLSIP